MGETLRSVGQCVSVGQLVSQEQMQEHLDDHLSETKVPEALQGVDALDTKSSHSSSLCVLAAGILLCVSRRNLGNTVFLHVQLVPFNIYSEGLGPIGLDYDMQHQNCRILWGTGFWCGKSSCTTLST